MKYSRLTKKVNDKILVQDDLGNYVDNYDEKMFGSIVRRLYKLENDIDNEIMIKLPCKVGDIVYVVLSKPRIYNYKVKEIEIRKDDTIYYLELIDKDLPYYYTKLINRVSQFGEFWFTDKSKAEERLKELNK